jgi:hypothetical protein
MPPNTLSNLWDAIHGLAQCNADQYLYVPISKNRIQPDYEDQPLKPERSYFRLWLTEMFLTQRRAWFQDWYPAVHSSVRLKFGNQSDVSFSRVLRAPEEALANGVLLNYRLTELMPFNGGVVELEAGLLALQGSNHLKTAIDVLANFSSLVAAPLGQALTIAEKVSSGMKDLLGSTNGQVHLPFHQTFTGPGGSGANELRPGYIAVLLATAQQIDKDRLSVKNDRLHYAASARDDPLPFQGYDYMLFRIEGREERDDWRLKNIQEPLDKAKEALIQGENDKAEAFKKMALLTAWQSPDLAIFDRRRVVQAIKDELDAVAREGFGAVPSEARDLQDVMMRRAMPLPRAKALGKMRFEELFE